MIKTSNELFIMRVIKI